MIKFELSGGNQKFERYIHHCEIESFLISKEFSYDIGEGAPECDFFDVV